MWVLVILKVNTAFGIFILLPSIMTRCSSTHCGCHFLGDVHSESGVFSEWKLSPFIPKMICSDIRYSYFGLYQAGMTNDPQIIP